MSIQHYQFQKALAHLAANIQRNKPKINSRGRFSLGKAVIYSDGLMWKFSSAFVLDTPSTLLIEGEKPFVDFVKLNDIKSQIDMSINNDIFDVSKVHKAIAIVDNYINDNQEIAEATLISLLNESTIKEKVWRLEYDCNNRRGEQMILTALVNVDTDELISTEIERVESNEK